MASQRIPFPSVASAFASIHLTLAEAITFGQALSLPHCAMLVRQLARCSLPFQCAHGRPTVVPVLAAGSMSAQVSLPMQQEHGP